MKKIIFLFILIYCLCFNIITKAEIPTTVDSRIKTIIYNPNEVIELTFHLGFQSFIEFEEDEEVELISLGESFPWKITPAGKRMFIRPLQINSSTNMTVITSKRTYMFQLKADSYEGKGDEELIYSVRFFYPGSENKIPKMDGSKYQDKNIPSVLANLKKGDVVNYDYSMTGNNDSIKLKKVFDDGVNTYFEFEDQNFIPAIYYVDLKGKENNLKYFRDGNYIVVNTIQLQFSLRAGKSILCIFNNTILN